MENMRTTRERILQKVTRTGAGWDDQQQCWVHGYNTLPTKGPLASSVTSSVSGEGLGAWLRKSSSGEVPWKQPRYHFQPVPEIPARVLAAQQGNVEQVLAMLDNDTVARLEDKDHMGRTVLHAAAAAGQIEVVRMLAARCAGWPVGSESSPPRSPRSAHPSPLKAVGTGSNEITHEDPESERAMTLARIKTASDKMDLAMVKEKERKRNQALMMESSMTAKQIAEFFSDENSGFTRKSAQTSSSEFRHPSRRWTESAQSCSPQLSQQERTITPPMALLKSYGDRGYGSRSGDFKVPASTWDNMLNTRDRAGDTPLHLSASDGYAEVVDELLHRGAEIETRNLAGRTALHLACMNGHPHVIFVLCSAGANARCRDREGRRPVDLTHDEEIIQFLWALVSSQVAVRGGPTPFGFGDADNLVLINYNDRKFAVENLEFNEESCDDGSVRRGSAAKVTRMRTAGPIHTGARLPCIRPLTPLESPHHKKYGEESVNYPRRGTAKTIKSVAFQLNDDESEDETIEEMRLEGRNNAPISTKTIRCRSGSGWYNFNARHNLSVCECECS